MIENLALMRGFSHTRRGKSMKRKTITSRVVAELANICMAITGMPAALRGEVFVPMCPGLIAVLESRNRRHQNQEPKRNDFLHLTTATVDTRDQNKGRQTVLSTFCVIALLLATLAGDLLLLPALLALRRGRKIDAAPVATPIFVGRPKKLQKSVPQLAERVA